MSDEEAIPVEDDEAKHKQALDPGAVVRQMYGSKRAVIDTSVPPVLFVATNSFLGLNTAAIIAAGYGLLTAIYRASRKQEVRQALFGLGGLGLALVIALRTGRASNYFLPNVISGYAIALGALISVAVKRPLTALLAQALEGKEAAHYEQPRVRYPHMVVTAVWAAWFIFRSSVRAVLIVQDRPEALGVTAIVLGTPATVLLVLGSFWFIRSRSHHEADAEQNTEQGDAADG